VLDPVVSAGMSDSRILSDDELFQLSSHLGKRMLAKNARVALAESCTGGWLAKCLTDVAGSSGWFEKGWVVYSNAAKVDELGVSPQLLEVEGAVSEATVVAMAQGARERSGADLALAVSGVAGPGGGSKEKPVGMVCFGVVKADGRSVQKTFYLDGDRDAVRRASVAHGLRMLIMLANG